MIDSKDRIFWIQLREDLKACVLLASAAENRQEKIRRKIVDMYRLGYSVESLAHNMGITVSSLQLIMAHTPTVAERTGLSHLSIEKLLVD